MKKIFCIWFYMILVNAQSQNFDLEYQKYIGSENDTYYFFQYGKRSGLVKPSLVKYELTSENVFNPIDSKKWLNILETGFFIYKNEEIELFYRRSSAEIEIKLNDTTLIFNVPNSHDFTNASIEYLPENNMFFIAAHEQAPIYKLDVKSLKFTPLPLIGSNLFIRGDYLFFEAPRYSDYYSSFPNDVYRVRLDDLKNPEKVLIQVIKWYPYAENILYASTDPFLKLNGEQTYGLYNLKDKTVAKSPSIATQNIIEINNIPYLLEIAERNGEKTFKLEEIPTLPLSFPYELSQTDNQLQRGKIFTWYNIPLKEKTFPNTFITHDLLFEATPSELKELSKDQLRILRNTFFAMQGYKFKSEDLNDFFNQFDWYRKLTMGGKSNADIIIWPNEKERVALIKQIEDRK